MVTRKSPPKAPPAERADSEKLWEAMLAVAPTVIRDGTEHPPEGSAQIARDYARSLLNEWHSAVRSGK